MANNKKGFGKFLVGLGLGAGLTALFTTKKGKEIREDLKVKIEDLIIKAKNLDVKEVGEEFLKKVEEIKEDLSDLDKEKEHSIKENTDEVKIMSFDEKEVKAEKIEIKDPVINLKKQEEDFVEDSKNDDIFNLIDNMYQESEEDNDDRR